MYIANPLYDVVFKYMMEDNKVAKKFISAIIDEKIIELDFSPQEHVLTIDHNKQSYTVYHLDFLAKIETENGCRSVIIEVQKAMLPTDIMRFRRYLGGQYQNPSNSYEDSFGKRKALQIYCIFFLGRGLGIKGIPLLEVNHRTKDRTTNTEVESGKNEFIEGLHHRSWIIQIPELPKHRRNDLEKLLGIFDQSNRTSDHHILNVSEEDFPEEYRPVIRRLQKASQSEEMKNTMTAEDDYVEAFRINERIIANQTKALLEKDKALSEKDKALSEKDKEIAELKRLLGK
ncbi:MAG: hypothetical protein FWF54_09235 [Candidatus Azobacteroides sp.]|nr:hypothetical protein [Candidatus Azobacteroides sp.]